MHQLRADLSQQPPPSRARLLVSDDPVLDGHDILLVDLIRMHHHWAGEPETRWVDYARVVRETHSSDRLPRRGVAGIRKLCVPVPKRKLYSDVEKRGAGGDDGGDVRGGIVTTARDYAHGRGCGDDWDVHSGVRRGQVQRDRGVDDDDEV